VASATDANASIPSITVESSAPTRRQVGVTPLIQQLLVDNELVEQIINITKQDDNGGKTRLRYV
jgi:hypothetical protein